MPDAVDLLRRGSDLIAAKFGSTAFVVEGLGAVTKGNWNELGKTETLELNGRRVSFSAVAEFQRATFPGATLAAFLALVGKLVTRSDNGAVFRVVGEVQVDTTSVR